MDGQSEISKLVEERRGRRLKRAKRTYVVCRVLAVIFFCAVVFMCYVARDLTDSVFYVFVILSILAILFYVISALAKVGIDYPDLNGKDVGRGGFYGFDDCD